MIIQNNAASTDNLRSTPAARGKSISDTSAGVGADQIELTPMAEQLSVGETNLTAAGSPLRDEDSARQSAEAARRVVVAQSATALLAQANLKPQRALRLLQQ